jgi:hypothetical protein
MRPFLRSAATLILAIATATCSDTPIAAVKTGTGPIPAGFGRLNFVPVFSKSAEFAAANADAFGIHFDSVHIVIRGLPDTTVIVKDTVVAFASDGSDTTKTLDLTVPVTSDGQRFDAGLGYTFGGTLQFYGHGPVQSHSPNSPPPDPPRIIINYAGPGAHAARVAIAQRSATLSSGQSTTLTATVFDSSGAPMPGSPILWSTSDATIATVGATGTVQSLARRGTATIRAAAPNGASDGVPVSVILPPASIALVSGGGQSGKAGSTLAAAGVVQVNAADGVGVAGVNVIFSAPTGGSVGTTSVATDGSGRASTTLRLGGAVGAQSFAATAAGFSVGIPATATPGDAAAIAIVAGSGQSDSVHKTLAPLSVRVTDQFDNAVAGATVAWARLSGGGSLAAASSTTNADGIATNTYTLGSTIGSESVSASLGGVAGALVTFNFTTGAGAAANIAVISGSGQTGRVSVALANPFVVRVTDVAGNAVSGVNVSWSSINGTIAASSSTDASGQASATMTLGVALGTASATARIANGQTATFSANVQAGVVSQVIILSQPTNGTPNVVLSPIAVALRDAGGNATPAVNPVTVALGNNPNGAVLTGTLTRNGISGTVTFDDLKLDKTGTGYTFVFTSGSLPSVTSSAFNMAIGAASRIQLLTPASVSFVAGSPPNPVARFLTTDAAGNAVAGVPIRIVVGSSLVTIVDTTVHSDTAGLFDAVIPPNSATKAGSFTLTATSTGLQGSPLIASATVTAGVASKLAVTNKPQLQSAVVSGATLSPQPSIQVTDQFGNSTALAGTTNVTAVLTNTTGVTLGGTTAIVLNAQTGLGSFTNLSMTGTGSTRIAFSEGTGNIKPDTSATINVGTTTGPATHIAFVTPTSTPRVSTQAGAVVPVSVALLDQFGNVATSSAATAITVSLTPPTSVSTLTFGGVKTVNTANGVATFTDLTIDKAAIGYTLTASTGSFSNVTSPAFDVTPATAATLAFVPMPTTAVVGQNLAVNVQVQDQFGNIVAANGTQVTVTKASGPGTVTGGAATATSNGNAAFAIVFSSAGTYTLTAAASGLPSITTGNISAALGAADHISISGPTGTLRANMNFPSLPHFTSAVRVAVLTATGDTLTASTGAVTLALSGGGASPGTLTASGNSSVSANLSSGVANFSQLQISAPGTAYQVTATYGTFTANSATFTVSGAPIITAVPTTYNVAANGSASPAPTAKVTEADGTTPIAGVNVVFAPGANSGTITKCSPSCASVPPGSIQFATDANGQAALSGWSAPLNVTSGSATLSATINGSSVPAATFTMNISNGNLTVDNLVLASVPASQQNNATFTPTVQLLNGTTNVPRAGVVVTATIVGPANCNCTNRRPSLPPRVKPPGPASEEGAYRYTLPALLSGNSTTVTATTDANGTATFSNIRVVGTIQDFAIQFDAATGGASPISATSTDISLTAGAGYGITLNSGDGQVGLIGAALATGLRVQLVDTSGNTATGPAATVSFSILTGGGSVSASAGTDVTGQATATWTLGALEGANTMRASTTIGGHVSTVDFSATGTDIHAMVFSQSPSSSGTIGTALSQQPWIQVTDGNGQSLPLSGVTITATVANLPSCGPSCDVSGVLTLSGTTSATTDVTGVAKFTTLGVLGIIRPGQLTFSKTAGSAQTVTPLTSSITLTPGAASTIINNSSAVVGALEGSALGAGQYPSVKVRDASGNAIPNSSVAVTFTVTAGSCTITGGAASPTVDALGLSTLSSSDLSLPATASSCTIRATSTPALNSPIDFTVIVASSSALTWLGTQGSDFSITTNWREPTSLGGAPPSVGASDAIFIPKRSGNTPTLSADASIASIKIEPGGAINLGGTHTLSVAGDVDAGTVAAGGGINNGTLEIVGSGSSNAQGPLPTTHVGATNCTNGGTVALTGTTTTGPITINCALAIGTQTLTTISGGGLSTAGTGGRLIMQLAGGLVDVAGASTFAGADETNYLTNGTFEARGDFSQLNTVSTKSYAASGQHKTSLWGSSNQSVSFADPVNSFFWDVEVKNAGITATFTTQATAKNDFSITSTSGHPQATFDQTFNVGRNFTANANTTVVQSGSGKRIIVAGTVTANASSDLGGVDSLRVTGSTFPIYSNTTAGKAPKLTQLTGSVSLANATQTVAGGLSVTGTLNMSGHTLTVMDSLVVTGSINLPTSASRVAVQGLARFNGNTSQSLTAGELDVGGNFIEESGVAAIFQPASGFLIKFNGSSAQDVSFNNPGTSNSYFQNVEVDNTSTSGVTFNSGVAINGDMQQKGKLTIPIGRSTTVTGLSEFRFGAATTANGTLALAAANFYNGSITGGTGTLTVAGACNYGSGIAGTDLLVGTFNITSCVPGRGTLP